MPPPPSSKTGTQSSDIPPLPSPPPPPSIDIANESATTSIEEESDSDEDFNSAWAKRKQENPALSSDKRDQMYGHIDRIATGEVGTLLDRFSDRFGSELDREIIVLRKKQQAEMRNIKPTV